jgi:xanthine dehydrogenase accessory factor
MSDVSELNACDASQTQASGVSPLSPIDVAEAIETWRQDGHRVALATVVDTKLSAPQPIGTKMAVQDGGPIVGAVSGGCVEGAVVEIAEQIIAGGAPRLTEYGIADEEAWDVGLPCGGEISIWVEGYDTDSLQRSFTETGRAGGRAAIVTTLEGGPKPGAKLLVGVDEQPQGTLGDTDLDQAAFALATDALWSEKRGLHHHAGALLFVDVAAPPARLLIVGAVDFAAQLSALARLSGWRGFVIDPRSRFATSERFPAAERVIAAWPEEAFSQLEKIDRTTAIAVLTHDPKLDDAALIAALASPAAYIGAMGSRRAQSKRRDRLLAAGVEEGQLERIAAPIGLDLGGASAAETALSIMGEIIASRNGRSGGRLAEQHGPIHGEATAAAGGLLES